jgi:hypothetical protein
MESVNVRALTYPCFLSEITGHEGKTVSSGGERNRGLNWKGTRVNYFPGRKKRQNVGRKVSH